MNRPDRVTGLVLIALGCVLLVVLRAGVGAEAVVAMVGGVFLVVYAVTRAYGFLVPGAILTGLGTGIVLQAQGAPDEVVVIGLGTGFLGIAVVDVLVRGAQPARLWPLIPGGILTVVGVAEQERASAVLVWWPLALVAVGLWLLLSRRRPPEAHRDEVAPPPPPATVPPPPPPATTDGDREAHGPPAVPSA